MEPDPGFRILVAQLGARRHYAVPIALHSQGLLGQFCTDVYSESRFLRNILRVADACLTWRAPSRWLSRYDQRLPRERVTAFSVFGFSYKLRTRMARTPTALTSAWIWGGRRFCGLVMKHGFGSATAVYAYTSAALELLKAARETGRACILDHATAPKLFEDNLVEEERRRHEGLFAPSKPDERAAEYADRQRKEWNLADVILCGSRFVRRAIALEGGPVDKIAVVPLGVSSGRVTAPRQIRRAGPLRVLFAGDDGLRKGIADLALAAELLGPRCVEIRAAGRLALTPDGYNQLNRHMSLLGHVPRAAMEEQYRWADVFVMPSVSDTFGLVILEAMAAGLPVITTPNTGAADVVRPDLDGYVAPIRSPEAIAQKLDLLASNEQLLLELSRNATARATEFTLDRYAERLVEAVRNAAHVGQ